MTDPRKVLARMFRQDEHEYNDKNMVYVGIAPTIRRLNELGAWDFLIRESEVVLTGKTTKSGKEIYRANVIADLSIPGLGTRSGSGSDESFDTDTAMKSAQAYALRKAANLFGVALYLWDEVGRDYAANANDLANLKRLAMHVARQRGFKGKSAGELAEFYVLEDPDLLQDKDEIQRLLEREGVI